VFQASLCCAVEAINQSKGFFNVETIHPWYECGFCAAFHAEIGWGTFAAGRADCHPAHDTVLECPLGHDQAYLRGLDL